MNWYKRVINEYEEKLDEEYGDGDTDHSWPSAGKGDEDAQEME